MTQRYCLLFLGLLLEGGIPYLAAAQTLYVSEGQSLYVTENTQVVLGGSFRNQGLVINQGTLYASEDWINEQAFRSGPNSEVVFSGTEAQRIDHRGQAFHHLTIEGGSTKDLLSSALVTGNLTLTEGIVISRPTAPLSLAASAAVVGGSEQSYVEATMQYQGNGLREFPLGSSGAYLPITLSEVSGQSPRLQVSVIAPNPSGVVGEKLERLSDARYWYITPTAGSFDGSIAQLTVNNEDSFDDLLGVVVAQADEIGGNFASIGQSEYEGFASGGSVTSALPVTLPVVVLGLTNEFSLPNQVLVPSAFAPNAPNTVNRLLKVYTATLLPTSFNFRIFDRWGNLVYHTRSLTQARDDGWDGRRQEDDSPATAGTYQYHLSGIYENGTRVDQSGTITLFR